MLTRDQAQKLTEKVLAFSKLPDCSIQIQDSEEAFVRFANNGVTTAGFTVQRALFVTSTIDGKSGTSQTTEFEDSALKAAVQRSEDLAKISLPNAEYVEPLGPQKYPDISNWDDSTASARGPVLVPHVKSIIDEAQRNKLLAAGFISRDAVVGIIANKRGMFGYSRATDSRLSTTVRTPTGSSSGWAGTPSVRIGDLNGADAGARAIDKCMRWKNPTKLDPGKYTVVLEPTATGDLLQLLAFSFSARNAEEGRSFLSKQGGGTLVGEKLFPEFITLRNDPFDNRLPSTPWSPGGLPNRAITWIENGVVRNLFYDRYWALKSGKQPTPFPVSAIMTGGDASLTDLIKSTERGLLVTRFWYIRPVNPKTVQLTGLTRDGLFLIENGEVTRPVMNFRFNESPVRLLQNAKKIGKAVRVRGGEGNGMIVPPVQATDFNFSSLSDAV